MKKILIIIGSAVLSLVLLWFGVVLLTKSGDLSTLEFFLLGVAALVGAIYSLPAGGKAMWASAGLALVSVYYFLRGLGVIERGWLTQLLGAASVFAALLVVYIGIKVGGAKPNDHVSKSPENE